ncbi:hypothetical protein FB451DRAFT_1183575 [Mycena latifolia]|nr:hypothetical protein FB451DRAFT_1183575 [Mycena latifolia]
MEISPRRECHNEMKRANNGKLHCNPIVYMATVTNKPVLPADWASNFASAFLAHSSQSLAHLLAPIPPQPTTKVHHEHPPGGILVRPTSARCSISDCNRFFWEPRARADPMAMKVFVWILVVMTFAECIQTIPELFLFTVVRDREELVHCGTTVGSTSERFQGPRRILGVVKWYTRYIYPDGDEAATLDPSPILRPRADISFHSGGHRPHIFHRLLFAQDQKGWLTAECGSRQRRLAFRTAAPATIAALINLVFVHTYPKYYLGSRPSVSEAVGSIMPKLYAVALIWTLNARAEIRATHITDDITDEIDVVGTTPYPHSIELRARYPVYLYGDGLKVHHFEAGYKTRGRGAGVSDIS